MGGAGLTLQEGMDLCKRRRPEVDPIPAFMEQLMTYESRCKKMGMLQSKDNIPQRNDAVNLKEKGMKRKTRELSIGPARGPPRPIGPVLGPPKGPTKNAIGPTNNSLGNGDNGGQNNDLDYDDTCKKNGAIIGQSLSSSPSADENDNTRLLEQPEARAKREAIGPLKKTSVPPTSNDRTR